MRRFTRLAALGVAVAALTACLGRVPAVSYYRLAGPEACPQQRSFPYRVAVVPFGSAPVLRQTALLYRPTPYETASYGFSRWEAMPSEMLTERVTEYLEGCHIFNGVTRYGLSAEPELLLRGRLTGFEEIDGPEGAYAELSLEAELVNLAGSALIWEGRLSARTPMADRSPEELARALSGSLARVLDEMASQMAPALARLEGARGAGGQGS